jgi:hypothetical protein
MTGAGLLLHSHYDRIGPVAIAGLIFGASFLCLAWVFRRSGPFSWDEVPSPHIAFDPILLLSIVLFGSALAWVETQFHPLDSGWRHHLLVMAAIAGAAAIRFDSRSVLMLSLTSFTAWRGVDARLTFSTVFGNPAAAIRWNSILCGVLFLALAWLVAQSSRKAHFESVLSNLGLLLLLGGLLSGTLGHDAGWLWWELFLVLTGAAAVGLGWKSRRIVWLSLGLVAAYVGLIRVMFLDFDRPLAWLAVSTSSLALVALLVGIRRRMKGAG